MLKKSTASSRYSALQQSAYQLASCTDQLFQQIEQQATLSSVIDRIKSSLDIDNLFITTATELRQLLNADRVGLFRFSTESSAIKGGFVAEDVSTDYASSISTEGYDRYLGEQQAFYSTGQIQSVSNIYEAQLSAEHLRTLKMLQIYAHLVIPVLKGDSLWGLLYIHQCNSPRRWQLSELEFSQRIADHFAIALQQAEYTDQIQSNAIILAQAEAQKELLARQKSLVKITNRIRRSLDWSVICETATTEVRHLLKADRVAIYRFNPDWSGHFVFESVGEQWTPLASAEAQNSYVSANVSTCSVKQLSRTKNADTYLQTEQGGSFVQGEMFRTCSDTHSANFSDCYVETLDSYQARAYAIIAIYVDQKLWGLLAAYQNSGPRDWHEDEVQLLVQVAEQLGIALKQSEHVQTIQQQSDELQKMLEKLQQSQVQLIQNEKMASLGQLVSGIAHEINNPVNFIYANLSHVNSYTDELLALASVAKQQDFQAFQDKVEETDLSFITKDLPKTLASMKIGAERIRHIVLSLRNFSRLDEADTKAVDVHQGIDSTLLILGHRTKAHGHRAKIEIAKAYADIPLVECYPAQLNQVFMNLLTNAIDALEEAIDAGKLDAENPTESEQPTIWIKTQLNERSQVEIRIRDNGIGLDEGTSSKMFDHFFTTKDVGKGTGLGLSISKQIVEENHSGKLYAEPTTTRGVEFIICLPTKLSA